MLHKAKQQHPPPAHSMRIADKDNAELIWKDHRSVDRRFAAKQEVLNPKREVANSKTSTKNENGKAQFRYDSLADSLE